MRKLFVTAIVLGLFAVTPAAFAQGDHNQSDKSDQRGKSDQGAKSDNAKGQNTARTQSRVRTAPSMATRNTMKSNRSRNATANFRTRNTMAAERTLNRTPVAATSNPAPKTFTATRTADYSSMRRNVQASRHFNAGVYRHPQGYVSRHWGFGERLPTAYFARDYWLTDYLEYALFAPPEGLVWVRVGDDALLIDEYSGEIVEVEYGVFV